MGISDVNKEKKFALCRTKNSKTQKSRKQRSAKSLVSQKRKELKATYYYKKIRKPSS